MERDEDAVSFLRELSVAVYEPPFSAARERLRELPAALRTVVLVVDFDTEVSMEGMLGFLENSPGRYLPETITAFETIGPRRCCARSWTS